ncbi:MAG: acetyl-CoA carboxylase carboxyltransferase subunit alpha [Alphaproteobacteria bacterium]|nr:acetyl-CoA carboxylase carboxyltransferase subunit alpha [Alphaproteobacteria bacterium]
MSKLEFEKPVLELEAKIAELLKVTADDSLNITDEISRMQAKADRLLRQTYGKLTAQQKVQVARHGDRPHFLDYVNGMIDDFTPLAGDRRFGEDLALLGGMGRFRGRSVVIMGHEKGHDTETRIRHNFGMARPEGYRKAQRLMEMAEKFDLPVITLVDTAGAYPGVGAEERGQAEAIAKSIEVCLNLRVPLLSVIIGEGGSGGAIAIAAADRIFMLEHSIYSVISPEGCASILWRSAANADEAAAALKLTAQDLLELRLIDSIIPEPLGGAHRHKAEAISAVAGQLERSLKQMTPWHRDKIVQERHQKFLKMGRAA